MREIKQIMINGIDVSKCVCLNSNLMCTQYQLQYGNLHCESKKNCYYKQLKRKELELQEAMDNYVKAINYYENKLAQIKRIINEVENENKF